MPTHSNANANGAISLEESPSVLNFLVIPSSCGPGSLRNERYPAGDDCTLGGNAFLLQLKLEYLRGEGRGREARGDKWEAVALSCSRICAAAANCTRGRMLLISRSNPPNIRPKIPKLKHSSLPRSKRDQFTNLDVDGKEC